MIYEYAYLYGDIDEDKFVFETENETKEIKAFPFERLTVLGNLGRQGWKVIECRGRLTYFLERAITEND